MTMAKIDELEIRITALEARLHALATSSTSPKAGPGAKPMAVDIDDPKWGDPEVKYVPKKWDGPSFVGYRFSGCPVHFLEFLAAELARSAEWKDSQGDEQKAKYAAMDRRDAAKALAWAARKRNAGEGPIDDADMPF
jgi:hypothetical protein